MSAPAGTGRGGVPPRLATAALIALAITAHALLLWRAGSHRADLDHDSTISVLAATGHQGAYERLPRGTWLRADDLQRLFRVEQRWPLRRIRDDLARTDLHPPLYFWLLHAQFLATGAAPRSPLALNFLLDLLTMLAMLSLGRRLWGAEAAAGATLLWAVSFGAYASASDARPYVLLALLSTLLVRLALAVLEREGAPSRALQVRLVLVLALGLLTHFHFALMLLAVGSGWLWSGGAAVRSHAWGLLALPVLAFAIFVLADPGFADSFARERLQAQAFAWHDLPVRLKYFATGLEGLARPAWDRPALTWPAALIAAGVLWRSIREAARARTLDARRRPAASRPGVRLVACSAGVFALLEAALYLGHVSPAHAAGGRYNAMLWPLLALLLAGAARAVKLGRASVPALAVAVALAGAGTALDEDAAQRSLVRSPAWQALGAAPAVVADHVQRGVLPRAVLHVPAGAALWIASGAADPGALLREAAGRGAPLTFLLNREYELASVRRAVDSAGVAGDALLRAGELPCGTDVVVWTPRGRPPRRP